MAASYRKIRYKIFSLPQQPSVFFNLSRLPYNPSQDTNRIALLVVLTFNLGTGHDPWPRTDTENFLVPVMRVGSLFLGFFFILELPVFICEVKQPNFFYASWGQLMNSHFPAGREPKARFPCLLVQRTCAESLPCARYQALKALWMLLSLRGFLETWILSLSPPPQNQPPSWFCLRLALV